MPISRTSSKSKSKKNSLNNKKVNCKDRLKHPGLQYKIALTCARYHNKDKISCNNDLKTSFLTQCNKINKHTSNTSIKKKMSLKNFLKSPFVKKLVYFTCKPYPPNKPSPKENRECKKLTTQNFSNQMTPS